MTTGPDPLRVLAERTVLAVSLCRQLAETRDAHDVKVQAAYRHYRSWMRQHDVWEDTNPPSMYLDAPGASLMRDRLEELADEASHAEIVVGRLELLMGANFSEAAQDRQTLWAAVDAWLDKVDGRTDPAAGDQ